ncbi:hypothetical protein E6Q11_00720 [Candidatus Dojkabacteria bacterium]|uniref:YtxH domain-containing protein n=1 Tax=Candidatus Dojkabacteria bacterium TaxID=2099670 RepID=A0A5C7JB73_9BACT|nr:MAG: hypothetical protein E6Q11_00720 [Candidatus Dojkabacteria bacterium]
MGNNNGKFSDGFLIGALIGGAAVFLLGTKKGNKILKAITQEGKLELGHVMEDIEERLEGIYPMPEAEQEREVAENITVEVDPSKPKRFFKKK